MSPPNQTAPLAESEHDVINPNSFEFVFVEIELKP